MMSTNPAIDHRAAPSRLAGKRILIAGYGGTLGACLARQVAEAGAWVTLAGLTGAADSDDAGSLVTSIPPIDPSDEIAVEDLFRQADNRLNGLDTMIFFPCLNLGEGALTISPQDWSASLEASLTATFLHCREAARRLAAAGAGNILVIMQQGPDDRSHATSGAFVAGLNALVRCFAIELGTYQVRANVLALPSLWAGSTAGIDCADSLRDAAGPVLFLLSDEASFVSGAVINADSCRNGAPQATAAA